MTDFNKNPVDDNDAPVEALSGYTPAIRRALAAVPWYVRHPQTHVVAGTGGQSSGGGGTGPMDVNIVNPAPIDVQGEISLIRAQSYGRAIDLPADATTQITPNGQFISVVVSNEGSTPVTITITRGTDVFTATINSEGSRQFGESDLVDLGTFAITTTANNNADVLIEETELPAAV